MPRWVQGGSVRRAQGGREHEGMPRPKIVSALSRMILAERLTRRREAKILAGKNTYQPKRKFS